MTYMDTTFEVEEGVKDLEDYLAVSDIKTLYEAHFGVLKEV